MYQRLVTVFIVIFIVLMAFPRLSSLCTVMLAICIVMYIIPLFVKMIEEAFLYARESLADLFIPEPKYDTIEVGERSSDWRWEIKKKVLRFTHSRQNRAIDLEDISEDEKKELIQNSYHLNYTRSSSRAEINSDKKKMIKARLQSIADRN